MMQIGMKLGFPWINQPVNKPNLQLNFADGSNVLNNKITFSRSSNATVTKSDGTIGYAPHNLLVNSESFDTSSWSKTETSVSANAINSPDVTITADKLIISINSTGHDITQTVSANPNTTYTSSVYLKNGGQRYVYLTINQRNSGAYVGQVAFVADTTTWTLGSAINGGTTPPTSATASIISVGNGWYRFSVTATTAASGVNQVRQNIGFTNQIDGINNFAGDGTSGVYIWGAQLEVGSTATTYNSTTPKTLLGFTEEFDNAAWTKSNSFVQTNLLTYSEAFDVTATWTADAITVTANNTLSPNGYQTADLVVPTAVASTGHRVRETLGITPTIGVNYAYSIYAKASGYNFIKLRFGTLYANFNISTGEVGQTNGAASSIEPLANGWFRCTFYGAYASNNTAYVYVIDQDNAGVDGVSFTGNGTSGVYLWGAQLVQGSVAGDYTRTDATVMPIEYLAPNGYLNAQKLVENTASTFHYINSLPAPAGTYTYSIYAKAGERNFVFLTNGFAGCGFNLLTGAVGTSGAGITANITLTNNGFYRCAITFTSAISFNCYTYIASAISTINYAGDGTSGIYIFGAQLSNSASLDPYVYNPAAALTSVAYYAPRFMYDPVTLQPQGLLIEEARTNLLLNSSLAGTSLATQNVTVTAVAHTISFYGTGTITLSGTATATISGTGAYPTRTTLTFTPTAGTLTVTVSGTVQYAQLEAGAFATSYIPTGASTVTRAADVAVIQGNNFSNWWNFNEGSLFANANSFNTVTTGAYPSILSASKSDNSANDVTFLYNASNTQLALEVDSGTLQAFITANGTAKPAYNKMAGVYKLNDFSFAVNGTLGTADTSGTVPIPNELKIGRLYNSTNYLNGTIKQISYYNTRLTDSQLQALTA